jgi:hypothetical protein
MKVPDTEIFQYIVKKGFPDMTETFRRQAKGTSVNITLLSRDLYIPIGSGRLLTTDTNSTYLPKGRIGMLGDQ